MRALLAALLLVVVSVTAAAAEQAATLVADRVFLNGDETITAEGAVEVFYKGTRLKAGRITYAGKSELLTIEGPILLDDGSGTIVLASQAELSRDLQDGIMRGARMVMEDQLQIAANELRRIDGRYTVLTKVVASSCEVCPSNPRPLWEIRADRVIHDRDRQRLFFDNAQIRVAGVPVMTLPRLRFPDPTVTRATGFLTPVFRSTSQLGPGFMIPYFITLGPSRDLTVTPYVSTSQTRTLNLRYREVFRSGEITFSGAVSEDSILPGETRGYLFGEGKFNLPDNFKLDFTVQEVTDRNYLLDYDISDDDLLQTGAVISRTRVNEYFSASYFDYQSLVDGEKNSTLPRKVGNAVYYRRFDPGALGGEAGIRFELHDQNRMSSSTVDSDGNGSSDGLDESRATIAFDWERSWVTASGLVFTGMAEAAADFYSIRQDPSYPSTITRLTPIAAAELRWPLVRAKEDGTTEVLEPVAQVVYTPESDVSVPNEDSISVEFDEGNLFALNRYPGADEYEQGLRANVGLSYSRYDPDGWSLGLLAGRIFRASDLNQFNPGTGLGGAQSDWLVAANLVAADGLRVVNRAVFDDQFNFTFDEVRMTWRNDRYDIGAGYVWQVADAAESRPDDTSALTLNAGWDIVEGWRGLLNTKYDFIAGRATRAGVGLQYRTECTAVDVSLSQRYSSSSNVGPVTNFNLGVVLTGFGSAGNDGQSVRRTCRG